MKLSEAELLELLDEQLSERDKKLLALLRRRADDADIVALMDDDAVQDRRAQTQLSDDDFRTFLLYEQGMKSNNKFVAAWFEFNLNFNNVMVAAVCQKHGYELDRYVVGDNEVAELLRRGGLAKNANLAAVLPELADMVAVAQIADLYERERHIDALRWQWIEQATQFRYFEIDNVLAYYLQACILHRWDSLNREHGEQVFRALLAEMKSGVKL